ncbi:MAG: histidine kinase [Spirochaetales bacterium]|nr:histidine kinase [Candidatus Physcosoma equi]
MTLEKCNIVIEFFLVILLSIISVSNFSRYSRKKSYNIFNNLVQALMLLIVMDMGTYALIGKPGHRVLLLVLWVLVYVMTYVMVFFFHSYLNSFMEENYGIKVKNLRYYIAIISSFFNILWIISAFNGMFYWFDEMNRDHYTPWRVLSWVGTFIVLVPDIVTIIKYRKTIGAKNTTIWLLYIFAPYLARVFQSLGPFAITYAMIALAVLVIHVLINQDIERRYQNQRIELELQQLELQENHQRILVSQIQPHFLYNVLNTICILCRKDPDAAAETTADFASYLRMNLNSIAVTTPVTFDKELEHVKTYLKLEKRRFGEELQYEFHTECENFFIPVLALQPIVENAVKHGIRDKDSGGTVTITTRQDEKAYYVTVEDDGTGFDTSKRITHDSRSHIGLENSINRVRDLLGGKVDIQSEIGKGTVVTITLPKATNTPKVQNA